MIVAVVGGGGSYPPPHYGGPSILVDTGDFRLLLDCGEDCLTGLASTGYSPCDIDAVYVSHIHIDHWAGIPSLATARIAESCPRLRVLARSDVMAYLGGYLETFTPSRLELSLEAAGGFPLSRGYRVETRPVSHSVPTYGVLILEGDYRIAVYTSDTRINPSLLEWARDVPLLIAEATLPSSLGEVADRTGHMTVEDFLRLASEARPGRAVAVHLSPGSLGELERLTGEGRVPPGVFIGFRGLRASV